MRARPILLSLLVAAYLQLCAGIYASAQTDTTTNSIPVKQLQDPEELYQVTLHDGTVLKGVLLNETASEITLRTENVGVVTLLRSRVKEIKKYNAAQVKNGVYWFPNPHATRYFFAPSAFNLKRGEGYYQNAYIIFNSVNYGVTDNFSVGGGIEFISLFASLATGSFQPIIFVTPKVGFKVAERVNVGGGLLYVRIPDFFDSGTGNHIGLAYGVGTYGTTDHNVTLGGGFGVFEGQVTSRPIITLNGMTRVGRNISLVTENWFAPFQRHRNTIPGVTESSYYYEGVFSYGLRFYGEILSVDLGLINNPDIFRALVVGVPYVDFVVKF